MSLSSLRPRLRSPILLAVIMSAGCGSAGPTCIPVSGKVTLDGGKVPGPGFIYFTTEAKEGTSRPGTAEFDADGNYRAKTFVPGDGLIPGKYVLRIDCWKTAPNMEGKPVVSYLPQKYQDPSRSGLELIVEPTASAVTFDIKLASK